MNYLRKPRELVSPQLRAVGGVPRLPYESYIESMAQIAPRIKEQERIREQQEEYKKLAGEERVLARRGATTGLALAGADVALRAKPYLAKFLARSQAGGAVARGTGAFGGKIVGTTLGQVGKAATLATKTTGITAGKVGTAGAKTLGATAKYLAPGALGAAAGSIYGGLAEQYDWGKKLPGGEEEWKVAGGALTGAATGFVASGFNPVGALVGAIGGAGGAKCIIITACTNPASYEVKIAREYRNRFMDKKELRGYYWLAERVVNTIKKHSVITWITKHILVDKLIDYGEWKLEKKKQKPRLLSTIITKMFLKLCRIIGRIIPTVSRSNGEVF